MACAPKVANHILQQGKAPDHRPNQKDRATETSNSSKPGSMAHHLNHANQASSASIKHANGKKAPKSYLEAERDEEQYMPKGTVVAQRTIQRHVPRQECNTGKENQVD